MESINSAPVANYLTLRENPKRRIFFRVGEPVVAPAGTKEEDWAVWKLPSEDSCFFAVFEDSTERSKRLTPYKAN